MRTNGRAMMSDRFSRGELNDSLACKLTAFNDIKSQLTTAAIFVDFETAFDRVSTSFRCMRAAANKLGKCYTTSK